ncbi:MAG: hypothetical protein KC766_02570, partial [Myxococcales bacterium]|nr:hypothetical protein [Myxococcales bacterium]
QGWQARAARAGGRRTALVSRGASKCGLAALLGLGALGLSTNAAAFVSTAVGGHPKELDVNAQLTLERGKLEPNENQASYRKVTGWQEYKLGVGYTWGDLGPLEFFSTRLEATFYTTPEETNDPSEWAVGPAGSSTPTQFQPECTAGAEYLGDGLCRFYKEDQGTILSATVSGAVIHDPKYSLGLFLKFSAPLGMNLEKFGNPRMDYLAFGWQGGVHLTPWLDYESSLYFGLGTRPFSKQKNGSVALGNLFHFKAKSWILPWKAGVKLGPYVEGDINERFDERYDRAYSPQVLPQPGDTEARQHEDRIRSARFALAMLPYFLVTEHLAVEAGYIQKFFGYDAPATQAYFVGLRGLADLGN